ncbi:MAG: 5-oxoprolinase subunit B family protein [Phycisphaerales bacterium]
MAASPPQAPHARWFSERHVQIVVPQPGGASRLFRHLAANPPVGLVDLVPAAESILLEFGPQVAHDDLLAERLDALVRQWSALPDPPPGPVQVVPFCADLDLAPDLHELANERSLDPRVLLERFCATEFAVDFLGFMPGFAYLAGLPAELAAPRLERPRTRVPAGSVGIGGDRAGIYPFDSPGGWRLIGRTPLALFDPTRTPPTLLTTGMRVRFSLISRSAFEAFAGGTP